MNAASLLAGTALAIAAIAPASAAATVPHRDDDPHIAVRVDSAHHVVLVTVGPFDLTDMSGMADMDMDDMHDNPDKVFRFQWPVDGYLRGFDVDVRDAAGRPVPREVLHHMIGVNFDRRQLVHDAVERLFGWGKETDPVTLPAGIGVPLEHGTHLGMYAMWHNTTGHDITGAYIHLKLLWIPNNKHPMEGLPLYIDVNNHIGGNTTFDVPPGHSTHAFTFEFPISGGIVGVGGHLHDYGTSVSLQDAESGKTLVTLKAKRDAKGHVEHVGRFIFGFNTEALHVDAGHKYRLTAVYDNPTGKNIPDGGMGHINGLFVPDDYAQWPKLDPNDPDIRKDVAGLQDYSGDMGSEADAHTGHDMRHMPGMKPDSTGPKRPR